VGRALLSRYEIDGETAEFSVGFRPRVPGAGAELAGITGWFELAIDEDGDIDLDQPVSGEFITLVDELHVGNAVVSAVARFWLRGDSEMAARGSVSNIERREDGKFDMTLHMEIRDSVYALPCRSSFVAHDDGSLRAWGSSRFSASDVGIPIPKLASPTIETRWEVDLIRVA